ncbi:hypothetical protein BJX96DRAFT_15529 [Aspergillus floccosus]
MSSYEPPPSRLPSPFIIFILSPTPFASLCICCSLLAPTPSFPRGGRDMTEKGPGPGRASLTFSYRPSVDSLL